MDTSSSSAIRARWVGAVGAVPISWRHVVYLVIGSVTSMSVVSEPSFFRRSESCRKSSPTTGCAFPSKGLKKKSDQLGLQIHMYRHGFALTFFRQLLVGLCRTGRRPAISPPCSSPRLIRHRFVQPEPIDRSERYVRPLMKRLEIGAKVGQLYARSSCKLKNNGSVLLPCDPDPNHADTDDYSD